jgi:death on curing protein
MSGSWVWLREDVLLAVHDDQLAEHGGIVGVRDMNLFQSAMSRPLNIVAYEDADAPRLAAAYGYGISRNHPFLDGNKRTAFVAVELFLALNGWELMADDTACVLVMLDVAAGVITEVAFEQWIRQHAVRHPV